MLRHRGLSWKRERADVSAPSPNKYCTGARPSWRLLLTVSGARPVNELFGLRDLEIQETQ